MNKQAKQFLLKIAIIVGVLILSAFITTTYGFFKIKVDEYGKGNVAHSSHIPGGVPDYYYYGNYASQYYLCANTHASDGSSSLFSESRYSEGTVDGDELEPTEADTEAAEGLADAVGMARLTSIFPGMQVAHADEVYWGPPTPVNFIGS